MEGAAETRDAHEGLQLFQCLIDSGNFQHQMGRFAVVNFKQAASTTTKNSSTCGFRTMRPRESAKAIEPRKRILVLGNFKKSCQ